MLRLLFRIIAGFLSGYAFVLFNSIFWWLHVSDNHRITVLSAWLISWIVLELIAAWRKKNSFPRLLTHLRYAPVATFIVFVVTVLAYDGVMILHSRSTIRQYVYASASPEASPSFELHNTNRGWCGNGRPATIYALYADVAAEGFESSDPAIRARSLRASIEVYDWLNGVDDGPFPGLIERARNDPDPLVRRIVTDFLIEVGILDNKDDAIEKVFRDLIQRYPSRPVYFLSFGETDPGEGFMNRFAGESRIKKLSQAIRNANQVIDPESGLIGVHVQVGIYYPIDEDNVKVGATWEFVQPVGKDRGWTMWPMEYQLRRVNGKWVIASSKIAPPKT